MSNSWVILKHTLSKESLESFHYDLLLEDRDFCRSWRLESFPLIDGPIVHAILLPPHKLYWLDREESEVSGGRGWAQRVVKGNFCGSLPLNPNEPFSIKISSSKLNGRLELRNKGFQILSCSEFDVI